MRKRQRSNFICTIDDFLMFFSPTPFATSYFVDGSDMDSNKRFSQNRKVIKQTYRETKQIDSNYTIEHINIEHRNLRWHVLLKTSRLKMSETLSSIRVFHKRMELYMYILHYERYKELQREVEHLSTDGRVKQLF